MDISIITLTQKISAKELDSNPFFGYKRKEIMSFIQNHIEIHGHIQSRNVDLTEKLQQEISTYVGAKVIQHISIPQFTKVSPLINPHLPYNECYVEIEDFTADNVDFKYVFTTTELTLLQVVGDFLVLTLGNKILEVSEGNQVETFTIQLTSSLFISRYQLYKI